MDVSQEPVVDLSWLKGFLSSTLRLTVADVRFDVGSRRSLLLKRMTITFTVRTSLAAARFTSVSDLASSIRATLSSVGSQFSAKWGVQVSHVDMTANVMQAAPAPGPEASASLNVFIIVGVATGGSVLICIGFLFYRFRAKLKISPGEITPDELASRTQPAKPAAVDSVPCGELRLEARLFAQGEAGQVFRGA